MSKIPTYLGEIGYEVESYQNDILIVDKDDVKLVIGYPRSSFTASGVEQYFRDPMNNSTLIVSTDGIEQDNRSEEVLRILDDTPKLSRENLEKYLIAVSNLTSELAHYIYQDRKMPAEDKIVKLGAPKPQPETAIGFSRNGSKFHKSDFEIVDPDKIDVTFDDIGGQPRAIESLRRLVDGIQNPTDLLQWGIKPKKGVLLYGPPGTGKTMLAKALAKESGARFITVNASDIKDMWVGSSEKKMQELFDMAKESDEPTVILFDEIDGLAPPRNDPNTHEATRSTLSVLLQNMDGFRSDSKVTVIATTNEPDMIDSALKRAGRFDELIEVGLPDAEGLKKIAEIHMAKADQIAQEYGRTSSLFVNDLDWSSIQREFENQKYSGADIAEIIRRVLENVRHAAKTESNPEKQVQTEDVLAVLKSYERREIARMAIGFSSSGQNLQSNS